MNHKVFIGRPSARVYLGLREIARKLRADNRRLIIPRVARRIHIPNLYVGDVPLDAAQAHHARDVLHSPAGSAVEVFDDRGATAQAVLLYLNPRDAAVRVTQIDAPAPAFALPWTVASAVPKGERADWMVEKLSELGAEAFIPLAAARSVVLPQGVGKSQRWARIAIESARQSRRAGVMRIEPLTELTALVQSIEKSPSVSGWFLSTEVAGVPIAQAISELSADQSLTLCIGPEGGWTIEEIARFQAAGLRPIQLGPTILRVETAAIAAAAVLASLLGR